MSVNVTNQTAFQALKGQDVVVTLNGTDANAVLPTLVTGRKAGVVSTGYIGYVSEVDTYGNTFRVKPITPDAYFSSGNTATSGGYLNASETVTLF
jgi:hypothetical protein